MSKTQTITIAKYKVPILSFRNYLKTNAVKTSIIKRNDKRVKNTHYCNSCGRLLSGYEPTNDSYKVYISYYKLIMANKDTYYICYNNKVCKNYYENRKHTDKLIINKVVE